MIFFTDLTTPNSNFCLLNIKHYNDERKMTKRLIFIDPSVMELRDRVEYSHVNELNLLSSGPLQTNEYISVDYPCDMNLEFQQLFVNKSIENNWKYRENLHYICAIQYDWMAQDDFDFRMNELEEIYAYKKKIVALGNLCRIMRPCKYFDHVIDYIIARKEMFYWIHIYGMALACIKEYIPKLEYAGIKVSVDSTKWTRPCNNHLKIKYMKHPDQQRLFETNYESPGLGCTKATRPEYFLEYIKSIQKKGIEVEY